MILISIFSHHQLGGMKPLLGDENGLAPIVHRYGDVVTVVVKGERQYLLPVLFVEDVEPCVKFWVSRFGFEKTAEVPDGDHLAFVMLQKGNVELMSPRRDASPDRRGP